MNLNLGRGSDEAGNKFEVPSFKFHQRGGVSPEYRALAGLLSMGTFQPVNSRYLLRGVKRRRHVTEQSAGWLRAE
jgi:hypothetical protein